LDRDPGGVPEPGLVMHITVIGSPHKSVDRHIFRHVRNIPAEYLPDIEVAIKDWRTDGDRADPLRFQQKGASWDVCTEDRRILDPDELPLCLARLRRRQHPDIGPRQQGLDAGYISSKEPGLYNPEHGAFSQQRCGLLGCGDRHDHMRLIRRKFEALDRTKHDVLVLEL